MLSISFLCLDLTGFFPALLPSIHRTLLSSPRSVAWRSEIAPFLLRWQGTSKERTVSAAFPWPENIPTRWFCVRSLPFPVSSFLPPLTPVVEGCKLWKFHIYTARKAKAAECRKRNRTAVLVALPALAIQVWWFKFKRFVVFEVLERLFELLVCFVFFLKGFFSVISVDTQCSVVCFLFGFFLPCSGSWFFSLSIYKNHKGMIVLFFPIYWFKIRGCNLSRGFAVFKQTRARWEDYTTELQLQGIRLDCRCSHSKSWLCPSVGLSDVSWKFCRL